MTLADLVRTYLEDRRKICEEKVKSPFGHDVQYYTKEGENVNSSDSSKSRLFSNTLDKTKKDDICTTCKSNKKSVITRLVTLPDGRTQIETVIRDGKGNEEKKVTYQENGKQYTTITYTDPSGRQKIERKVTGGENSPPDLDSGIVFPDQPIGKNPNTETGYDYWYNKLFKPNNNNSQDFWKNDIMPFDFNNMEENINKLFRIFENDTFPGGFKSQRSNEDSSNTDWFVEDSSPQGDKFSEETKKFIEQFDNDAQRSRNKKNKKSMNDLQTQVDNLMKNFIAPKSPALFQQFAERAIVELPEEKTPLDKFIEPDEDVKRKRISIMKETAEFMKRLDNFFTRDRPTNGNDEIYSDIQPKDQDIALFVPQPDPTPNFNDFGSILAKRFGPMKSNLRITTTSKMRFPNGNLRIETVNRDKSGNIEKSVTYQAANKTYNIVTVTTPAGVQIRRQRKLNFSEDELPNFRKQWDSRYQADLSD